MTTDTKALLSPEALEAAKATITAIVRRCRGPREAEAGAIVAERLAAGDEETAKLADEVRRPCGADFNAIILAGPWDGAEHPYECPKCGVVGTYRAPTFAPAEA